MNQIVRCKACGAFLRQGDRFCWSCGQELAAPPPRAPAPRPLPEPEGELLLLLRRAHLAQQRGRLEEAIRLTREALQEDPQSVPALTLLAELLRAVGDQVGAVEAAQLATEAAAERGAPPGALQRAREERAAVEQEVVRELSPADRGGPGEAVLTLLSGSGREWYRSRACYLTLSLLGLTALFFALVLLFRGAPAAYVWFGISTIAAGWCYHDAETNHQVGIFWGPLVLCLGIPGLGIYLLARE